MKFKIKDNAFLTTESPQSSYGIPVLEINDQTFGPAESDPNGNNAAQIVASWARQGNRTVRQIDAAHSFLSQWPQGPQVDKKTKIPFRAMITRSIHREFKAECGKRGLDMTTVIEGFMKDFIKK